VSPQPGIGSEYWEYPLTAVLKFPAQFVGSPLRKCLHSVMKGPSRVDTVLAAAVQIYKSLILPLISARISLSFVQRNVVSQTFVIDSHSLKPPLPILHKRRSLNLPILSNGVTYLSMFCPISGHGVSGPLQR
jgi:hypothetical protein